MTCIGAIKEKKEGKTVITIAADSCSSFNHRKCGEKVTAKIFKKNDFVIAMSGSARYRDIIKYNLGLPPRKTGQDINEYLAKDFIDSLISILKAKDFLNRESDIIKVDGTMLLAVEGKLFVIYSDFNLEEIDDYTSIGSGADYMIASLYSTKEIKNSKKRLTIGLEAAALFDFYVTSPFDFETITYETITYETGE